MAFDMAEIESGGQSSRRQVSKRNDELSSRLMPQPARRAMDRGSKG
jgi:hypothetical protein